MSSIAIVGNMDGDMPGPTCRKMHPFFTGQRRSTNLDVGSTAKGLPDSASTSALVISGAADHSDADIDLETPTNGGPRLKRHKPEHDASTIDADEPKPRRPRKKMKSPGGNIAEHLIRMGAREASPSTSAVRHPQTALATGPQEPHGPPGPLTQAPQSVLNAEVVPPKQGVPYDRSMKQPELVAQSKKVLRYNPKTGTIGSPPRPKQAKSDASDGISSTTRGEKSVSKVVRINYGADQVSRVYIGQKIDNILDGNISATPGKPRQPAQNIKASTTKETHPFFLAQSRKSAPLAGKDASRFDASPPSAQAKQLNSTPCSSQMPQANLVNVKAPPFLAKTTSLKGPGARLPAWPSKEAMHVRGCEPPARYQGSLPLAARKRKGNTTLVHPNESVLQTVIEALDLPHVLDAASTPDSDEFAPPPPQLRLPHKHFESGLKLQERISPELRCVLGSHEPRNAKKWDKQPGKGLRRSAGLTEAAELHPALRRTYDSISNSLSAFDKSQCESLSWAQKYSPSATVEVLQLGREPFLLREWLETLKVQSVDTGIPSSDTTESGSSRRRAMAKGGAVARKKRKTGDLEGFIIDSDEEADEMDEISEPEADDWPSGARQGLAKKTVIRAGDAMAKDSKRQARLTNTVVISGPHGCGKTAAVYAVAKDLGFEVFEINPSSRRSGKDVLEKIGDMTRNHLVQHRQPSAASSEGLEEDVEKEIQSGKQATMSSFFKPKTAPTTGRRTKNAGSKSGNTRASPKSQKQSLILLDEADILYDEDKQFWSTVIGLITQSKRPFIITCNDEALIPIASLSLHGIFRFSPPPIESAVDRLLLIAACEGHALRRDAVEALYNSRGWDLRACVTELNYWCQMGVGDRRGGLDWFYPRWPKGVDLDEEGNIIRVVSEGTYLAGMGWLDRDSLLDNDDQDREEELLRQAWGRWSLDLGHWQDSLPLRDWVERICDVKPMLPGSLLDAYDQFADAMSVADVCSSLAFATSYNAQVDATLPQLSPKAREDYTVGQRLLETPLRCDYDDLSTALSTSVRALSLRSLRELHKRIIGGPPPQEMKCLDETRVVSSIHQQFAQPSASEPVITRHDYSLAFDVIATRERAAVGPQEASRFSLDPSVFDRTMALVSVDVAPYIRGIVTYDSHLQKQRLRRSNLLSQGGRTNAPKRMRTTRAAYSALEGSSRSSTRPERWFKAELNDHLVMRTGGADWQDAIAGQEAVSQESPSSKATASESEDELGDT